MLMWGAGRAGAAAERLCPNPGSAGRAQAAAVGFAACFSTVESQGETCCPLLRLGQTQWQRRVRVGSGSSPQRGSHGSSGSCFSVSINQGRPCLQRHWQPSRASSSSLVHEPPLQN